MARPAAGDLITIIETGTITSASGTWGLSVGEPFTLTSIYDTTGNSIITGGMDASTTFSSGPFSISIGYPTVAYDATDNIQWTPEPSAPLTSLTEGAQGISINYDSVVSSPATPIPSPLSVTYFSTGVTPSSTPSNANVLNLDSSSEPTKGDNEQLTGNITSLTISDTYTQPDNLVEAVLSDEVYHDPTDPVNPPNSSVWAFITCYYDSTTGYYGEAWGKIATDASGNPIPGQYSEILQVNRGTVFSPAGTDPYLSTIGMSVDTLENNSLGDKFETFGADAEIVLDISPAYFDPANTFYSQLSSQFSNTPIVEVGQSLGGSTSDDIVAEHASAVMKGMLSAVTFNSLPLSDAIPNGLTDVNLATVNQNAINYYVGNEVATQGFLTNTFVFTSPIGTAVQLPPTPVSGSINLPSNIITIHNPDSAVAQLYRSLYAGDDPATQTAATNALLSEYSNPNTLPGTISEAISNLPATPDINGQYLIPNLNHTVTYMAGGNGQPLSAQPVFTVPIAGMPPGGTVKITSVATAAGAIAATEADFYDMDGNLTSIERTETFPSGNYEVLQYTPAQVLQNIYTLYPSGETVVQSYSASGDLNTSSDYNPNNKNVVIQQDQGDPTIISNSTIDIGTAVVSEMIEDSDQSVLTELGYGEITTTGTTYIGVVANSDGTADIVDGQGEFGNVDIISFGTAGLADDILDINQAAIGTIDVTLDIEPGTETDILSDQNVGGVQEGFAFTGPGEVLQIGTASTFNGKISSFRPGDTIDLAGVSATDATLGANNVFTVQESGGGTAALQLDPNQNFAGISFDLTPDGNGGTEITASSLVSLASGSVLSLINPTTGVLTALGPSNPDLEFFAEGNEAALDGYLYVVTSPGDLRTVDIQTGEVVNSVTATPGGFVADNLTGQLVGIYNNMPSVLNPTTGAITPIGAAIPNLDGVILGSLAAANGLMYFVGEITGQGTVLFTIDIKTGAVVSSAPGTTGIAVADTLTNELLVLSIFGVSKVDPATGALTQISAISNPGGIPIGTAAAQNGRLYFAGFSSTDQETLYTVDIATGAVLNSVPTTATNVVADETSTTPDIPGVATFIQGDTLTATVLAGQDAVVDPLFAIGGIGAIIVQGPGTGEIEGTDTVASLEIAPGGSLLLQGGTIVTDPVTVDAGGNISGYGKITGNETVNGTITASGGILDITGNVSGTGTLAIASGASLQLAGTVAATNSLTFTGAAASLILGASANVMASVGGFGAGDAIGLEGQQIVSAVYATNTDTLLLNGLFDLNLGGTYQQSNFSISAGEAVFSETTTTPPTVSSVTPNPVEKGQTTEIGTAVPSTVGDTLTLQQTGGNGTVSLQLVSGIEEVIYTAPTSVPASTTDAVSYTVTENGVTVTAYASVQLDAGPSITAVTPTAVGRGQTTEIGTVTPGLAGDTLTLKQTGGSGTLALQLVSGVEEVIYTAPASVPANTTDAVTFTITDQHNDAVATGNASVQLKATGASITAITPATIEKGQTTEIGTVTPSTAGDTLTLQQTGGSGTVALQLVSGVEEVIYTAPVSVPTSTTDAVSYTVTENGVAATGNASVQLDAGPSITAVTPTTVEKGQTTVIGTITPGLAGDTLTLKETAGAGTLSLGAVQANGTQQVIYTAPATVSADTTDDVAYTISDQHKDDTAQGSADVQLNVAALPSIAAPATVTVNVGQTTQIRGVSVSESPTTSGETFTVVLTDTNGLLSANTSASGGGGTVTPSGGGKTLTIVGTLAQVNADLTTLADDDDSTAPDMITVNAHDSNGGNATPGSIAVTVNGTTNTVNLNVGTLAPNSTNNEFLLEFALDGVGNEKPYAGFLNNGTNLVTSSEENSYLQSDNPNVIFDFSFSVASPEVISQDSQFDTFVGSPTSSIALEQGGSVVATGTSTGNGLFDPYIFPTVTLLANTQYDLVITTLGVPSSVDTGFSGTQGWGQVALDVSAPTASPPPVIAGTVAGQTTSDETTISPFIGVSISDSDIGQTETVTVTLSAAANGTLSNLGGGSYNTSTGVYTDTGTAALVTTAVDGLVFTPTPHQVAPGQTVTTTFTIKDVDTAGESTTNSTTTVIATAVAAMPSGFDGDLVSLSVYYPAITPADLDLYGTATVVPGEITFPNILALSAPNGQHTLLGPSVTFTSNEIQINYPVSEEGETTATAAFNGFVFQTAAGDPTITGVSLTSTNIPGLTASDLSYSANSISLNESDLTLPSNTPAYIDISASFAASPPPVIAGTVAGQTTSDETTISPFIGVSISDSDIGQTETVTVTLSAAANGTLSNLGGGSYNTSTGVYTDTGTAALVTTAVDGLVFTPTPHQVAPGQTVTTTFTIKDVDTAGESTTNSTTTVIATAVAAMPSGFDGDLVSLSVYYPAITPADLDLYGTATVVPGEITFPNILALSAPNGQHTLLGPSVTFTSNEIQINYPVSEEGETTATAAFNGFVFQTAAGDPTITGVSLTSTNIPGLTASDLSYSANSISLNESDLTLPSNTPAYIDISASFAASPPPVIAGTVAGQTTSDETTISPFIGVSISDSDIGQTETVTVTLSAAANGTLSNLGGGSYNTSTGVYTDTGTAALVTTAVDGLVFTPTPHQVAPGQTVTTTFTIKDVDTAGESTTNSTTTVIATAVAALPIITGAVARQNTIDINPISPFSGVTIADANLGQTETITVTLSAAANGTLSNLDGGTYNASTGEYSDSGTAAVVTAALDGLVFIPTTPEASPGAMVTTAFTIADTDAAGATASNAATTVTVTVPPTRTVSVDRGTSLVQVGSEFFLWSSLGSGPSLKYGDSVTMAGEFGGWTPIGAVQQASGGYLVAWRSGTGATAQYVVWNVDSNGNYLGGATPVASGSNFSLEELELTFDQDLNGDGTIGPFKALIATDNGTSLFQIGDEFALDNGGGSGPMLHYQGSAVTAGEFGGWTPIGAVQTASGYLVAWSVPGANEYVVWNVDNNGNYLTGATAAGPGSNFALEELEPTFNQDLNGDGTIGPGPVTKTIRTDNGTSLVQIGNNFALRNSIGIGPALQYQGSAVTVGEFGGWTPIGAVQTAIGYLVAWSVAGANEYVVWSTDSNGNYLNGATGVVSGTDYTLEALEPTFGQDLNGDGTVGPVNTPITPVGGTRVVLVGNRYALDNSAGSSPLLSYQGSAVTAGEFGGWTPIGAVQTASGYLVAWSVAGANEYVVWNVDNNGNYLNGATAAGPGSNFALEELELTFNQDLNGDGTTGPGPVTKTIQTDNGTSLVQIGNDFALRNSSGIGPALQFQGGAVTAGEFGGWTPIGAVQTTSGYLVAWSVPGANEYVVWNVDSNGNYLNGATAAGPGSNFALEELELTFGQDLNGDGTIGPGPVTKTIQTDIGTSLVQIGNDFALRNSSGIGPALQFQGGAVTAGEFGGWTPIGAVQTTSGYLVAWQSGTGATAQYVVWQTDSDGNYLGGATGVVAGSSIVLQELELQFNQDLNGDGTKGPAATPIATDNGTRVYASGGQFYLTGTSGDGTWLTYQGSVVTSGEFGGWTPIGAVQQSGGGYLVAWKMAGQDQYVVWNTDSNGNYLGGATGVVSGEDFSLEDLDPIFGQNLNGEGTVSTVLDTTTTTGGVLNLTGQTQATTINLGENTASASAGLNAASLSFIGTPDAITLGSDATKIEYTLAQTSGIETIANFVYGQDELNIDLRGAASGLLQAYDTTVGGVHAIAIASSTNLTQGVVLLNMTEGQTAANLLASHTTFIGGHALIS